MPRSSTLTVSVTLRHRKLVESEVESGRRASASEVVREGLRLYEEHRRRAAAIKSVRAKIDVGIAQLARGESVDGEQAFRDLRAKYGARRC